MKKSEKRMILTIVVVAGIIIVGLLIWRNNANKGNEPQNNGGEQVAEKYVQVLEDGTKLNTSNKLKETKKVDELEISGIQLTNQNGLSVILGTVKNTSNRDLGLTVIEVTLYDDKKNVLEKVEGFVSPVKAGESVQLNMGVSSDYANAYDFSVVKK